jgi:DNA-binding NarL/FixJ family response regulator
VTGKIHKVLIVDDHAIVVEGLKAALEREAGWCIVGTAHDGARAVELTRSLRPDVIIMDNSMPHMDGLSAAREIKKTCGDTKIIIFSMLSNKELVGALFREGISGYVLKGQPFSELIMALNAVVEGGTFYSEDIGKDLRDYMVKLETKGPKEKTLAVLSEREKEVFLLLADGVTSREISRKLYISQKTVESHKYNIMDKLEVKTIQELTKIAVKHKLIEL